MSLSKRDILHIAHLAKLPLTDDDVDKFGRELSPIVDHFHELEEVNTDNTVPTSQTTGLVDILRTDEIDDLNSLPQEKVLSESPTTHNGYVVVPLVLSKESA